MKSIHLIAISLLVAGTAFAETADEAYRAGMAAIQRNEPAAAKQAFERALQLRPDHAYARYQLGRLKSDSASMNAKRREAQLASVRLPEVSFEKASLSEALVALNQMVETESAKTKGKEGAFAPNFNVQDPTGKLGEKEVTLNLKNIPANAALQYLLDQVNARVRYDAHATVVLPNGG